MKVVIIEDEPLAQEQLKRIITENFQAYEIVAILESVEKSVDWLKNNSCDLIFMDIQLTDGKSFEIFEQVEVRTPIIFTTAYDEYAIQAFQVNSIGYILKPIDEEELKKAIQKLSYKKEAENSPSAINQLIHQLNRPTYRKRFVVKLGDNYHHVNTRDIAYVYSEEKVTFLVTKKEQKYIVDETLDKIETALNPQDFFRLARNIISSVDAIKSTSKYFNSRLLITLSPTFHDKVLVSRVRVADFLRWLDS
ncbi:LytR/AlgR family response regulator transcription factor [Sediminitomix flava]|uniref:LytTR family two component transcriptional regulator n=1 Tax=Sediminitomix flava TaxID=379075 RepID=A0A315ZFD1_SEDFL|nr:LytTR family DNA-binding domain-containing protein [Sediminitomix flava]PWJ44211.1 LytTR family two component transcriptional regulator [Sediminitomix flava]